MRGVEEVRLDHESGAGLARVDPLDWWRPFPTMTDTLLASFAAIAFFLLLMQGVRVGFGLSALGPRARAAVAAVAGTIFPLVVYLAVRLLDDIEALRPIAAFFETHRRLGLLVTGSATALGFALFMGGILHLVLTSTGSEGFSLAELKDAIRRGAWRRSRRWRRRIVVVVGVGLFTLGLFGLFVVVGPVGVKLLLIAVFLQVAVALVGGAARA